MLGWYLTIHWLKHVETMIWYSIIWYINTSQPGKLNDHLVDMCWYFTKLFGITMYNYVWPILGCYQTYVYTYFYHYRDDLSKNIWKSKSMFDCFRANLTPLFINILQPYVLANILHCFGLRVKRQKSLVPAAKIAAAGLDGWAFLEFRRLMWRIFSVIGGAVELGR